MTFLSLQPLSIALLPAVVELDQRCFGGLWTASGYQRELESPNSELLVLIAEAEGRRQEAEAVGATGRWGDGKRGNFNADCKTQNSKLSSEAARSATQDSSSPLTPHPSPLLGIGCYWAILEEAHITLLAIDPTFQRQGLGQALLGALMASASTRGLERATLEVRVSNASALSLYQKFGFREAGRRRRYYPDNGEDALVLWRGGLQAPDFTEHLSGWQQQIGDRLHSAGWQLTTEATTSGYSRFPFHSPHPTPNTQHPS